MAQPARAQIDATSPFATFSYRNALTESFVFDNDTAGSSATFDGSADIWFTFVGFEGDPAVPSGPIAATMTLSANTTSLASVTTVATGMDIVAQPFNAPEDWIVIRDASGKLLLSVEFTGVELGLNVSNEANLRGGFPGTIVNFDSDYLTFDGSTARSFEIGFVGTGGLTLANNQLVADFTVAANAGTFTTNGGITAVPEPAALGMLSVGLVGLPGYLAVRRRQKQATV